ncbi:unnamed protein product, partial [Polarella glacialis]
VVRSPSNSNRSPDGWFSCDRSVSSFSRSPTSTPVAPVLLAVSAVDEEEAELRELETMKQQLGLLLLGADLMKRRLVEAKAAELTLGPAALQLAPAQREE